MVDWVGGGQVVVGNAGLCGDVLVEVLLVGFACDGAEYVDGSFAGLFSESDCYHGDGCVVCGFDAPVGCELVGGFAYGDPYYVVVGP